jgi:hypothetical protein
MVDEDEVYLGGFYSPIQLSSGKLAVGAGLYATNRRLFIFRKDVDVAFNKIAGRKDFVPGNLTPEQNQAIVFQLSYESSSQMVLRKEEISTLEMKEPPGVFRTGHLEHSPNIWRESEDRNWKEKGVRIHIGSSSIVQSPSD